MYWACWLYFYFWNIDALTRLKERIKLQKERLSPTGSANGKCFKQLWKLNKFKLYAHTGLVWKHELF